MVHNKFKFLLDSKTIMLSTLLGIIIGMYFKQVSTFIEPLGDIYILFLQMVATVMMPVTIITSIGKFIRSGVESKYLKAFTLLVLLSLIFISITVSIISITTKPFTQADLETKKYIGQVIIHKEEAGHESEAAETSEESSEEGSKIINYNGFFIKEILAEHPQTLHEHKGNPIISYILDMIPENIFSALINGRSLKVIFVSIIFGFMLKYIQKKSCEQILTVLDGVLETFHTLIEYSMYIFPFCICSIIAYDFQGANLSALFSLWRLLLLIVLCCFVLFVLSSLVIWKFSNIDYFKQFKLLKNTIATALTTGETLVAIPSALMELEKNFDLDKDKANFVISISYVLIDFGILIVFLAASFYTTTLYGYSLHFESILIIIFYSIEAAMLSLSVPRMLRPELISIILVPLGLPAEPTVIVLLLLAYLLEPISTLAHIYLGFALTFILSSNPTHKNAALQNDATKNALSSEL